MKNRLHLLFTGILCIQFLYGQEIAPGIDWQKVYGGSNTDFLKDFIAITDGYVGVGYSGSTDGNLPPDVGGYYDAWMIKLDANGNVIWWKTYGGSENDVSESVVPANDGGYIVLGVTASADGDLSTPIGNNDFWVTKVDSNGNLVWSSVFGGTAAENAYDIIALQDGNYLAVGSTNSIDVDAITSPLGFESGLLTCPARHIDEDPVFWFVVRDGDFKVIDGLAFDFQRHAPQRRCVRYRVIEIVMLDRVVRCG